MQRAGPDAGEEVPARPDSVRHEARRAVAPRPRRANFLTPFQYNRYRPRIVTVAASPVANYGNPPGESKAFTRGVLCEGAAGDSPRGGDVSVCTELPARRLYPGGRVPGVRPTGGTYR